MSPSGAEVIRQIKSQIDEVDPSEVNSATATATAPSRADRRARERRSGTPATSPAPSTSRAATSSRASRARSRTAPRTSSLYCASGNRSALAAHTLKELLGYENVESMTGGITLWKDRGYDVEVPKSLTKEQRERYSRHLLVPGDRARGPDEAARGEGAAARRRRPRLADRALPRRRRRRHARHRRRRRRRPLQPAAPGHPHHRRHRRRRRSTPPSARSRRSTRTSRSSSTRRASTPRTSWRSSTATT